MHRTFARLLASGALAFVLAGPSRADLTISLVQIGGTYSASVGVQPGDSLVLGIDYTLTGSGTVTAFTLVDPSLYFDPLVATFVGGVETGSVNWSDPTTSLPIAFGPVTQGSDIQANSVGGGMMVANGWEKATLNSGGVTAPCQPGVALFCTTLGSATFTLSGVKGVIDAGGWLAPGIFPTVVADGAFTDVSTSPGVTLGAFAIVPEPATAALLALGLASVATANRRRRAPAGVVRSA